MAAMPHVAGVRHSRVRAGDVELHVAEAGSGEPVLLVHGWPQHWFAWRHVIGPLAERFHVIAPDLRGFGWSEAPGGSYTKVRLAHDLGALLDALGITRARVVGHDWGGFASFLLALSSPERVSGLLAVAAPHPWMRAGPAALLTPWRYAYAGVIATPLLGRLALRTPALAAGLKALPGDPLGPEARASYAAVLAEPDRGRASESLYRTFAMRELPGLVRRRWDAERLDVPARLLLGGDDDVVTPGARHGFERSAPAMELEIVEGAGHFIPEERPELVVERALALPG